MQSQCMGPFVNICFCLLNLPSFHCTFFIFFLFSGIWEADKSEAFKIVIFEEKNCCSLESLFHSLAHLFSLSLSHNLQDDFFCAAIPPSWRDAGMLLWELLPFSSLLEVGLKDLWVHLHVKWQLGVLEHPVKGLCLPWHRGLWESSESSWGFVLMALLKPEPRQQPPNRTKDKKVATWEILHLDQHVGWFSPCWSYTVTENKWI